MCNILKTEYGILSSLSCVYVEEVAVAVARDEV